MKTMVKLATLAIMVGMLLVTGCTSSSPSETMKKFYTLSESGKVNDAYKMLSKANQKIADSMGGAAAITVQTDWAKQHGKIVTFEPAGEEIKGDMAVVKLNTVCKDGATDLRETTLLKENGTWKIAMF